MIAVEEFCRSAEAFLESCAPRRGRTCDAEGEAPNLFPERETPASVDEARRWMSERFDAGFGFIQGPPELGGAGLSVEHDLAYSALEARFAVPDTTAFDVSTGVVAPTILDWGTNQQKGLLLRLHRGDIVACQLFSEPDAGSDLASASTQAVRDGDGWRLTGAKVWTSGAHYADVGEVLCRTPEIASEGSRHGALTMFLLDMASAGVTVRPLRQMTGTASFNEVVIDDAFVADDDRLGGVGEGWRVAASTLAHERTGSHTGFVGRASRVAARLVDLARQSHALAPPSRHLVADVYAREQVFRQLLERATGGTDDKLKILVKLGLTEHLRRTADAATAVMGVDLLAPASGTVSTWSQFILGVPGVRIAAGTDEIQRNVIAERLLGLPR